MLIYIGTPMVAASIWKKADIERIEASLYRKVLRIGNMIPNRAILHTMTSIRLASEVVNYLSRDAWEQFRRQNRVTAFFERKEPKKDKSTGGPKYTEKELPVRAEKVFIPKIMNEMMLAVTGNGTSTHFGMNHMCHKHKRLFTLDHIETCDTLEGCKDIRKYANMLRD